MIKTRYETVQKNPPKVRISTCF